MTVATTPATGPTAILGTGEFLIRRAMASAHASPFLAHCELGEERKSKYLDALALYINRDPYKIPEAFKNWPLLSVWAFAAVLSEGYGEDSAAVYSVLEESLGARFDTAIRSATNRQFRSVCRRFGLCYEGSDGYVKDYLALRRFKWVA